MGDVLILSIFTLHALITFRGWIGVGTESILSFVYLFSIPDNLKLR